MRKVIFLSLMLVGCNSAPRADRAEVQDRTSPDSTQADKPVPRSPDSYLHLACCIPHFIDSVGADSNFRLQIVPRSVSESEITLKEKNMVRRWHGPEIQKWLPVIDSARLVAYSVQGVKGGYKVLTAPYFQPTGLATSFTHWFVLKNDNQVITHFQSLLDVPSAAFRRRGKRSFEILMAEFSDEFYHGDRDLDNLSSYRWLVYSFANHKVQERAVSITQCRCEGE